VSYSALRGKASSVWSRLYAYPLICWFSGLTIPAVNEEIFSYNLLALTSTAERAP